MNVRRVALVLGVLTFAVALAALFGVVTINTTQGVIILVGLVATVGAVRPLYRRLDRRQHTGTPDPEHRVQVPVPGASLQSAVDQFRTETVGFTVTSQRITDGLHGAAVAVLTRFRGLSPAEARRQVDAGTWTDDEQAAAFLSPELEATPGSLRERLARRLDRRTGFRLGVRRTAAAVAAVGYAGLDDRERPEALPQYDAEDLENVVPQTTAERVDDVTERARRPTGYWAGIGAVALFAVGVGAASESPAVVLAGVVAIGYAGFAYALDAPTPKLSLERTLEPESPEPGDEVDVTLTITNESDALVPDLRLVDGVPSGLAVAEGSSRIGTTLRPNETVALEYTVVARRGRHEFDPVLAFTRDLSRSTEREFLLDCEGALSCEPVMRPTAVAVPLRTTAATFSGRLTTTDGGSGTQFHSVREYRRNDPLNRIDWNRHARTGELATLEFHEERAARVVVLVDSRKAAYLAPEPDAAHAVDRSVDAAGRIAASLLDSGDTVGLAAFGATARPGTDDTWEPCWLAPASGHHHRVQFQRLLTTHPQFSTVPPETTARWLFQLRVLQRRLSAETQILFLSPLCDYVSAEIARRLDARGHAVTVISPDPTAERTTSQQLARVARRIRQFDLQRAGIPVIDWRADETIDEAFTRANAGDRR
ncbi:DUF58 domain-containing protein [Natrononativus amylolyticus]|uniref:DUF58 domain-containing protein n=1 Tax=Natrononativus amylolyticus TaxID=2963434 RepID=UPI0020CBE66A|nr:DUF58 domain-containing protein [Natrononativus amylolyticus]